MKRLIVGTSFVVLLLATKSHAQSGAVIPQPDAGHASQASCVILKRMGRVDHVTSHLYSFGKQFRYIEGKLPDGFASHGGMTDHDVRDLQAQGAEVVVLESHYTSEDLEHARADCRGGTGKTPNQAESKPLAQAPAAIGSTSTATLKADDSASSVDAEAALIDVSSAPTGADLYIDERFFGRTPSTIVLRPGGHEIAIKKSGFMVWQKKLKLASGHFDVDAELVPRAK
jgi:PEGA domain